MLNVNVFDFRRPFTESLQKPLQHRKRPLIWSFKFPSTCKTKNNRMHFFPLWVPVASKQRQLYDSTVAFCSKHYSGIYFFLVFCANSDIQLKKIPIAKKNNFCATATAQFSTLLRLLFVSFRVHPAQFNNLKTTISCWIANVPLGMMLLFMLLLLHSGNNRK